MVRGSDAAFSWSRYFYDGGEWLGALGMGVSGDDFALTDGPEKEWFGGEGWVCVCWVSGEFDCIL